MVKLDKLAAEKKHQLIEPTSVTRLLVVSYFIALSLNLVEGADFKLLATPFVSTEIAHYLMRAVVILLCAMVLFGIQRKAAALILALVVFWPSYMTLHASSDVSGFWRDLALIGALVMSSSESVGARGETNLDRANLHDVEVPQENVSPKQTSEASAYRTALELARSN